MLHLVAYTGLEYSETVALQLLLEQLKETQAQPNSAHQRLPQQSNPPPHIAYCYSAPKPYSDKDAQTRKTDKR